MFFRRAFIDSVLCMIICLARRRYTFTNPSPDTVVRSEDLVFCLKRIAPWKPQ